MYAVSVDELDVSRL